MISNSFMKFVFISDTHDQKPVDSIPDGDFLIHCGDIFGNDSLDNLVRFNDWMGTLPHKYKIVIAGNHDFLFENDNKLARSMLTNVTYLQDEAILLEGYKIYGSPWQPWFYDWAFNLQRGEPLRKIWALIPDDTDILVTHGPPFGIFDKTVLDNDNAGCEELLKRVQEIKPLVHAFGHIHEGYGMTKIDGTIFINASICNFNYNPINKPIVVELNK